MRIPLVTSIVAFVCLALAGPAHAQRMIFSDPSIDDAERDCIVLTLGLDDDQTDALDSLLGVYASEIAELSKQYSELEDGTSIDESRMDAALELMNRLAEQTASRRDTLFRDLTLMLSQEQAERVPIARQRLERMSITTSEISNAFSAGVSLGEDPVTLAVRLELPGSLTNEQAIAFNRALDSYDRGLKEVTGKLEKGLVGMLEGIGKFQQDPMGQMEDFEKVISAVFETTQEYRSVHQDRGLAIARTLPEKLRVRWTDDFMRSLYPGPYERTKVETLIDRLLDDTTLEAERYDALLLIADTHRDSVQKLRDEWCNELDDELRDMEFSLMAISSYSPFATSIPFRDRMKEIDDQTLTRLRDRVDRELVDRLYQHLIDADRNDDPETFDSEPSGG